MNMDSLKKTYSILIDKLPEAVTVSGSLIPIKTDFRIWIRFENLMRDKNIPAADKIKYARDLCYIKPPAEILAGVRALIRFYTRGDVEGETADSAAGTNKPARFDFGCDADYIFAAFYSQYKIDLTGVTMHWWKFRALLGSLGGDNLFNKIIGWRTAAITADMPDRQREFLRDMKEYYALADGRSEDEKIDGFTAELLEGL